MYQGTKKSQLDLYFVPRALNWEFFLFLLFLRNFLVFGFTKICLPLLCWLTLFDILNITSHVRYLDSNTYLGLYPSWSATNSTVYRTPSGPVYWYVPVTWYPCLVIRPDSIRDTPLEVEQLVIICLVYQGAFKYYIPQFQASPLPESVKSVSAQTPTFNRCYQMRPKSELFQRVFQKKTLYLGNQVSDL